MQPLEEPKGYYALVTIEQRKYPSDDLVQTWQMQSRIYNKPGSASAFITRTRNDFERTFDRYTDPHSVYYTRKPDTVELVSEAQVFVVTGWEPWVKKGKK